ncbi:hypothetical protein I6U48_19485 [Clostridium sp. PL3]|uniref:Uncharacterized protein n=1 Tax=Clostridium thailandense TaxID=2794346 RepID=A0A949TR83_9CLOT|nr:hypothetical protein [Clostridium thailandense]MBV7275087.1 hypothetical protein [Clostridium thailandense]
MKNASTSTNSYKSGSFSNSKSNNTTSNSSNIKGTPIKTVKITSTPSIESTARKDSLITSGMFKGGILKSSNSIPTKGMPVIISMDGNDIYVDCTDDGNYVCNYYTASPSENSSSWQGNVGYLASSPIKKSHAGTIIFGSLITVFFLRKIIKLSRPH